MQRKPKVAVSNTQEYGKGEKLLRLICLAIIGEFSREIGLGVAMKKQIYVRFTMLLVLNGSLGVHATSAAIDDTKALREAVTITGIRAHQKALQDIADQTGGTRVAGGDGYRASVAYVQQRMVDAGYETRLQEFSFTKSEDNSAPKLIKTGAEQKTFEANVEFASMSGNGYAEIEAEVEAVDLLIPSPSASSSSSGCEKEDFKNFKRGNIALIQRGTCTFQTKAENALAAGALGVIIFNEGTPSRLGLISSRLNQSMGNFPVVGARFSVGDTLRAGKLRGPTGTRVFMRVDVLAKVNLVHNVIAETLLGDSERVVVVGAHLDSVEAGPGMNDNGSGSATILKIAEEYAKLGIEPTNKLRFIWFGAEEFGLLGSDHYVASLSEQERRHILAMLNFDMLGSPNYARFVYDGDNSDRADLGAAKGPEGSGYLEHVFLDYFSAINFVTHPSGFDGRSDYGPFIEKGIPAGGLFSGAEGRKSATLAAIYGGVANAPFDACYHQACDNFANTGGTSESALALKSLDELSDAAAHAVMRVSKTRDEIRPPEQRTPPISYDFDYRGGLLIK